MNLENVVKQINTWYPKNNLPIPINQPTINEKDINSIIETLNDNWVSTAGPIIKKFEEQLKFEFDQKEVVAVNSGTSALHLSLLGMGIAHDDQIITTPLTFVAPINAIKYVGAHPLFIDISQKDLSLDINLLNQYAEINFVQKGKFTFDMKTNKKVKALLSVDVFGHIGDIEEYRIFCDKYGLKLIVDSAESLGSKRNGNTSAKYSDITTTSFNGNKIITTGAGGAIISKDEEFLNKVRHLATTANTETQNHSYFHNLVGYNYRLPALNASLGLSQLSILDKKIMEYREIHKQYSKLVNNIEGLEIFEETIGAKSNYWLNLIMFKHTISQDEKIKFLKDLNRSGIGARNVWHVLHQLPFIDRKHLLNYPIAESIFYRGFNLPTSSSIINSTN